MADVIENNVQDSVADRVRSSDFPEGDPLRTIIECAENAKDALALYLWEYHEYDTSDANTATILAEEEAETLLLILFPFFNEIVQYAKRKEWAEGAVAGWNAAKQNVAFPVREEKS